MDWFLLTAMVLAGWVVVSTFATERSVRLQQRPVPVPAPAGDAAAAAPGR